MLLRSYTAAECISDGEQLGKCGGIAFWRLISGQYLRAQGGW